MKIYILILPVAALVTYSQIIVKWRANTTNQFESSNFIQHILRFLSDPIILSAYGVAFVASLGWLYIVTKLPLTIAFPIYIGVTFVMVSICGWYFLAETLTLTKIIAIALILCGIVLGGTAGV